jgi:hypothetical protein
MNYLFGFFWGVFGPATFFFEVVFFEAVTFFEDDIFFEESVSLAFLTGFFFSGPSVVEIVFFLAFPELFSAVFLTGFVHSIISSEAFVNFLTAGFTAGYSRFNSGHFFP